MAPALLQVSWLYVIPADIFDLVQTSALKVFKGVQAVAKFIMQVGLGAWEPHRWAEWRAAVPTDIPCWLRH